LITNVTEKAEVTAGVYGSDRVGRGEVGVGVGYRRSLYRGGYAAAVDADRTYA
jgi:hypothetical protein